MKTVSRISLWALGALLLLASCESLQFSMMKDDELIAGGVKAWNDEKYQSAKAHWSSIKAPAVKAEWLAKIDQYDDLDGTIDDTSRLPTTPTQPVEDGWAASVKGYKAFDPELKLPASFKTKLVPVAKAIVQARLAADKPKEARDFQKSATDFLGTVDWADEEQAFKDYEKAQATRAAYLALYASLDKGGTDAVTAARNAPEFDDKIAGYEGAITVITKAETTLATESKKNGYRDGSTLAGYVDRLRTKRATTRTEMERTLRGRATDFKERIGEEFARTPDDLGVSDPASIVKFYEQTKVNVTAMQAEVITFAGKYPKIIDADLLKDVADQKKALEDRIAVVTAEWRRAQSDARIAAELASRGKPVLPLQIGLFNPVPLTAGQKASDAKSRPAKFKGTFGAKDEAVYWWGMVDIPAGTLNDLVFTVSDSRPVRVFNDNTLSGKEIEKKKLKDLINRGNKAGNSWPVMNAGAQFPSGKFFFELGKGSKTDYSGDVVVYSSFISRQR